MEEFGPDPMMVKASPEEPFFLNKKFVMASISHSLTFGLVNRAASLKASTVMAQAFLIRLISWGDFAHLKSPRSGERSLTLAPGKTFLMLSTNSSSADKFCGEGTLVPRGR